MRTRSVSLEDIAKVSLFRGMSTEEKEELLGIATCAEFENGEYIFRQGGKSQNLMIVLSGQCQVVTETDEVPACSVTLAELKPYDHFGEMSFFDDAPHSANVIARGNVQVIRFKKADFEGLVEQNSMCAFKLAYNALVELAERLRKMDDWVTNLVCTKPSEQDVSEWSRFRDKLFESWVR